MRAGGTELASSSIPPSGAIARRHRTALAPYTRPPFRDCRPGSRQVFRSAHSRDDEDAVLIRQASSGLPIQPNTPGREIGGSGLGLSIGRGIVQAHGGRIWAESDGPSGGSHDPRLSAVLSQAQDRDGADAICAWTNDPQTLRYARYARSRAE